MLPVYPLTAEQIEIRNLARNFASREISPIAKYSDSKSSLDEKTLSKICQSGLVNSRIPEEFGGLGLSLTETCLIVEEFAFACSAISSAAEASELAISYLLHCGSQDQKARYLAILTEHNALAGIGISTGHTSVIEDELLAQQHQNYISISGSCPMVLNASFAKWFIIACPLVDKARNKGTEKNSPILAYFIVPKDVNGLEVLNPIKLLGRKAADVRALRFTNVQLDPMARIYTEASPMRSRIAIDDVLDIALPVNAPIIASGCLGLASAAFSHATKYAQERETFGVQLFQHQALAFMMADMATEIESLRAMIYIAIDSFHAGAGDNFKMAISTLSIALEMAVRISNDAVQVFGGYGYTKEYPVEKLMRDAKAYQLFYENDKREYLAMSLMKS